MEGTVQHASKAGFTKEQAELIGQIDDCFEKAIELGLISGEDATNFGRAFAEVVKHHLGM